MISLSNISESKIYFVKVDKKSDIDKVANAFDGYTNPSLTDELILDTALINECEDAKAAAVEVFGETTWNELPVGLICFHG
jgi:hypothetical protein